MSETMTLTTAGPWVEGLLAALRRLDGRLGRAVATFEAVAPDAVGDPYRGLYISRADVELLLARPPGAPTVRANGAAGAEPPLDARTSSPHLARLATELGLESFDLDVLLIALAPELDLRYERLYAYLHDDVTRRRPTVDLALNLLCASQAERLARRAHFAPTAPLARNGLLHVIPDPGQLRPPLLAHYLKPDDRLVDWLLGSVDATLPELATIAAAEATIDPAERRPIDEPRAAAVPSDRRPLATLARNLVLPYRWPDLVLPPDQLGQLREICARVRHRRLVFEDWGFGRKLAHGRGLHVLFAGPPGTGKTMAAAVIANELGLDLYRIDLAQVVSKYIGETEKNLEQVFAAAERTGAILFFDEADALFGKRSEVKDAHDRYANLEISYLLQRMEEYDGLAILATNLRHQLDEAFLRRLQVSVEYPFPDEDHRRKIWASLFPPEAPLAPDVDFDVLARELKLAGGNLKNIALAAAFYAATERTSIRLEHVARAAWREHQKLGRDWDEATLSDRPAVAG